MPLISAAPKKNLLPSTTNKVSIYQPDFSYEQLHDLIVDNKVHTIEELLPLIPYDLRQNFTLMKSSPSLQEASEENPRAILFGKDASLVLTFNGSKNQKGYQKIEVLHFLNNPYRFELREIDFSEPQKGPQFSEANPPRCVSCHRANPQPIWEAYNRWPNSYGEDDDEISSDEASTYAERMVKWKEHPRYKYLEWKSASSVTPYYTYWEQKLSRGELRVYDNMPNLRLTRLFSLLNSWRNVDQVVRSPLFLRYGPLLSEVLQTGSLNVNRLDKQKILEMEQTLKLFGYSTLLSPGIPLREVLFSFFGLNNYSDWNLGRQYISKVVTDPYSYPHGLGDTLMSFHYILQTQIQKFYPDFPVPWIHSNAGLGTSNRAFQFISLTNQLGIANYLFDGRMLAEKKQRDITTGVLLKNAPPTSLPSLEKQQAQILEGTLDRCIACHSLSNSTREAPYIPFEDSKKLKIWLAQPGHNSLIAKRISEVSRRENTSMPPIRPLSPFEEAVLLNYLQNL